MSLEFLNTYIPLIVVGVSTHIPFTINRSAKSFLGVLVVADGERADELLVPLLHLQHAAQALHLVLFDLRGEVVGLELAACEVEGLGDLNLDPDEVDGVVGVPGQRPAHVGDVGAGVDGRFGDQHVAQGPFYPAHAIIIIMLRLRLVIE